MRRLKAVAGYDNLGILVTLHATKKEAKAYYERSANVERRDFYFVYPEQLKYLPMATAINLELTMELQMMRQGETNA